MLSDEEIYFLDALNWSYTKPCRAAELGCYIGGTTSMFGDGLPDGSLIEVYDLFEHNDASRKRLKDDKDYEYGSFYKIWSRNTSIYSKKIDLLSGDLQDTCLRRSEPLDILYVDIVKHHCLVNPMVHFYDRLNLEGILIHQDYFHWQSPWLVYQMEALLGCFELLGDVGFNMTVYRKTKELQENDRVDFLSMDREDIFSLFDRAIARYTHSKRGMLRVSKLRLAMEWRPEIVASITDSIIAEHSESPRVMRYLKELQSHDLTHMW